MVEPLLDLDHRGKAIFRMSVNPQSIISRIELGTSSLMKRIDAVNRMCDAGYPCGLLIAPVIIMEGWKEESAFRPGGCCGTWEPGAAPSAWKPPPCAPDFPCTGWNGRLAAWN